jgi:hypothetical protein
MRCVTSQKIADLVYFAAEACSNTCPHVFKLVSSGTPTEPFFFGDERCLGIKKIAFRRSVIVRYERIAVCLLRWLRTYSEAVIDHALARDPTNSRTTLVTFMLTFFVLVIVML